jgi:hypothetical protein
VYAGGAVSQEPQEVKRYFVSVTIDETYGGGGFNASVLLLAALAFFDSPQLQGGLNGATLDVTLPVIYCVLEACPATIDVSLVWEPVGKVTRDYSNIRTDTGICRFNRIEQVSYTSATVSGFVSNGTTNLASGEADGTLRRAHGRVVGFGDPAVCL